MSGQNFNAPHRPRFVTAGTYDLTLTVARLFEVVPVEGQGREANGSEAVIHATVTSDGSFKVCHELTRFAGHVTRVGGPYTRTVRFVMEQDGMLALTALHDPLTVCEWSAVVKPVEPGEVKVEVELPVRSVTIGSYIRIFRGLKCTVPVPRGGKRRVVLFVKKRKGEDPKLWWIDPSQLPTLVRSDNLWILGEYEVSEAGWELALPERQVVNMECPFKVEDPADRIEAAIASGDFWVRHSDTDRDIHVVASPTYKTGRRWCEEGRGPLWDDNNVRLFFRKGWWALLNGVPAPKCPEPDPTALQGAAALASRAKQKWLDAKALSKKLRGEADEARKAEHAARIAFDDAARNLVEVAGASEED